MRWEPTLDEEKTALVVFFLFSCLSMTFFAYMAAWNLAARNTDMALLAAAFFAWSGFWAMFYHLALEDNAWQSAFKALPKLVFLQRQRE